MILTAICAVDFHLTEGQKIESLYPADALDADEAAAVAFSAFPDSMSFELSVGKSSVRDTSFSFRIPRSPSSQTGGFLHGFVFCRQRQDETLQRGGVQRSIAVLSPFPLSNLLGPIAKFAGPVCINQGPDTLKTVFQQLTNLLSAFPFEWGSTRIDLPLGHAVLHVDLPELATLPADAAGAAARLSDLSSAFEALAEDVDLETRLPLCLLHNHPGQQIPTPGLFTDVDVFTPLAAALPQLWTLWEILVLGEPLIVAGPTPAACSSAVTALASLPAPYAYNADFRPYFTIHDSAFAALAAGGLPSATSTNDDGGGENGKKPRQLPALLGVTNPFILKSLSHWKNVISTGYTQTTQIHVASSSSCGEESISSGSTVTTSTSDSSSDRNGRRRSGSALFSSFALRKPTFPPLIRRKSTPQSLLTDPSDGVWLSYRAFVNPDVDFLDSLVLPSVTDGAARRQRLALVNSTAIHGHFEELSRAIIFPLLPYITPAPPPPLSGGDSVEGGDNGDDGSGSSSSIQGSGGLLSLLAAPPPLPELNAKDLIKGISNGSITVPEILLKRFSTLKDLSQFYTRFLNSPPLVVWLTARRGAALAFQAATWREAWRQAGGAFLLPGVSHGDEVGEMEDYLKVENQARAAAEGRGREVVLVELHSKFVKLPKDVQDALVLNPDRAELLKVL